MSCPTPIGHPVKKKSSLFLDLRVKHEDDICVGMSSSDLIRGSSKTHKSLFINTNALHHPQRIPGCPKSGMTESLCHFGQSPNIR